MGLEGFMVKISLTPIIDVVFILLIFFMLATNFQSFNKTDVQISNESASISQSDQKIYLVEFDKEGKFTLNYKESSLSDIKSRILEGMEEDKDNYIVVVKGTKGTKVQNLLNIIADFKISNIDKITLGITRKEIDDEYDEDKKEKVDLPLLRKL
jgi:biopolymer transport protein ExbD